MPTTRCPPGRLPELPAGPAADAGASSNEGERANRCTPARSSLGRLLRAGSGLDAFGARPVDLLLLDQVGVHQSLVEVIAPALLEDGDDPRAPRRQHLLDVGLDLVLLMMGEQAADAGAEPGTDETRREQ